MNRSRPSRCDSALATRMPRTLLPAWSNGGAKVPSALLPGDTVTMSPPMPLLPGRPGPRRVGQRPRSYDSYTVFRPTSARTAASTAPRSFGSTVNRSVPLEQVRHPRRQRRPVPGRPLHRIGELRRMRGRHRHGRHAGTSTGKARAAAIADGSMRIGQVAAGGIQAADLRLGARIVQPEPVKHARAPGARPGPATVIRPVSRNASIVWPGRRPGRDPAARTAPVRNWS